jgi:hypothetical protein
MNEQDLRSLVREAIERHLGRPEKRVREPFSDDFGDRGVRRAGPFGPADAPHASHIILKVAPGSEIDEGMCVIEPSVRCNHCGFCQSYGH